MTLRPGGAAFLWRIGDKQRPSEPWGLNLSWFCRS
jgi:hypothetical protein